MFGQRPIRSVVSRRSALAAFGTGGAALALTSRNLSVLAQNATPAAESHPIVGAWLADTDADDPKNPPSVFLFTSDGLYSQAENDGSDGYGAWRSTGENTADLTILFLGTEDTGGVGSLTKIRASIEVSADGNSFTGPYTLELIDPKGVGTGEYGPATATGTRIMVEAQGTPKGTLNDLFSQLGGGGATPEAGA